MDLVYLMAVANASASSFVFGEPAINIGHHASVYLLVNTCSIRSQRNFTKLILVHEISVDRAHS